ncbi:MAG: putative RND superfamily exporter protein, partial [Bradymonadia bacterium]
WAKIQLDIGTVMVASIMLGLIVDDTVHFLARYQREWLAAGCPTDEDARAEVARRTGVGTGRALTTTSLILSSAFFLSLAASFQPNVNFGVMCGIATLMALTCDLVALPAVIRAFPLRPPPSDERARPPERS